MTDTGARGFDASEYAARTASVQALMQAQGLSGLLLMTEAEVRYFSGFHTLFWQSPTRPWFLFIPDAGKPVAVIPEIGAVAMRRTWIDDIRTWSAPAPRDDGLSLLSDLLMPLARRKASLGILKGHETALRMPLGDYERFLAGLPGLQIDDATDCVRSLRMVKSKAEIGKLAHICRIMNRTYDAVPTLAGQGIPLDDVFRNVRREALRQGADDVPYLVGGAETGGYRDVISPPGARPLAEGDILMLDSGATCDGYFSDFDRNWAIGRADPETKQAYDLVWRATQEGLAAVRPGVTCREVFHTMNAILNAPGESGAEIGRYGHGLGMQLTEWPSIAAFDDTPICENMVLTLEPSVVYGDGRIMVHEEVVVVREGGAELLTERATADLIVI